MKTKALIIGLLMLAGAASGCGAGGERRGADAGRQSPPAGAARQSSTPAGTELTQTPASGHAQAEAKDDGHGHSHGAPGDIPAFETDPASLKNLPPMLRPEQFSGKQRVAYQLAREIPETIAQLPCFCHCDKGFGHKSLHSCFVDDHAAHCAICMDEAITAHKLQKEEKLKPEQIRQRIIAQYGT